MVFCSGPCGPTDKASVCNPVRLYCLARSSGCINTYTRSFPMRWYMCIQYSKLVCGTPLSHISILYTAHCICKSQYIKMCIYLYSHSYGISKIVVSYYLNCSIITTSSATVSVLPHWLLLSIVRNYPASNTLRCISVFASYSRSCSSNLIFVGSVEVIN